MASVDLGGVFNRSPRRFTGDFDFDAEVARAIASRTPAPTPVPTPAPTGPDRPAGALPADWLNTLVAGLTSWDPMTKGAQAAKGTTGVRGAFAPLVSRAALLPVGAAGLASLATVASTIANRDPSESALTTGAKAIGGGVGAALPFVALAPLGPAGLAAASLVSPLSSGALSGLAGLATGAIELTPDEKRRRNTILDNVAAAQAKKQALEILAPTAQLMERKAIENKLLDTQLQNAAAIERERWAYLNQGLASQSQRMDERTNAAIQAIYNNGII